MGAFRELHGFPSSTGGPNPFPRRGTGTRRRCQWLEPRVLAASSVRSLSGVVDECNQGSILLRRSTRGYLSVVPPGLENHGHAVLIPDAVFDPRVISVAEGDPDAWGGRTSAARGEARERANGGATEPSGLCYCFDRAIPVFISAIQLT